MLEALTPFLIGLILGFILRSMIKLIIVLVILATTLFLTGLVNMEYVENQLASVLQSHNLSYEDTLNLIDQLKTSLPIGSWFFIGLALGILIGGRRKGLK